MKEKLKRILSDEARLFFRLLIPGVGKERLSVVKTIYYNLRIFPFSIATKLPLYIFNNVKVYRMGKINLDCPIETGMFRIGLTSLKSRSKYTKINNLGEIVLKGRAYFAGGVLIENKGKIVLEGGNNLTEDVMLLIRTELHIGKHTRIGFHSQIMDSDDHYLIDVNTNRIRKNKSKIIIGSFCWIGSNSVIRKGANLPDYTIVASNSLILKDFTNVIPAYSVIGGSPAKLLVSGYRRIFNKVIENNLNKAFKDSGEITLIADLSDTDIDSYCLNDALHNY